MVVVGVVVVGGDGGGGGYGGGYGGGNGRVWFAVCVKGRGK